MNVFTTDHPITAGSFRVSRRVSPLAGSRVVAYPAYLLLVSPFWALDGRGHWILYRSLSVRFATPPPVQSGWFHTCVADTLIILTGGILIPMLPTEKRDGINIATACCHYVPSSV